MVSSVSRQDFHKPCRVFEKNPLPRCQSFGFLCELSERLLLSINCIQLNN
jgi:hypothetical protein